jgi:hypothetical protein
VRSRSVVSVAEGFGRFVGVLALWTSRSCSTLHHRRYPSCLTRFCYLAAGNSVGPSSPVKYACTDACRYSQTDLPCWAHVAITVQIRSHQRCPLSPRVPWVMCLSITTKRIACSAVLFVGWTPGVVMKWK